MRKPLNEKVAIITGAGQGIGKGLALALAKRGVKIVCVGRRLAPIEETAEEIKALAVRLWRSPATQRIVRW